MTVPELRAKYIRPGLDIDIISYSLEATNGEICIPFTNQPKDLSEAESPEEYSRLLNTKEIVKYEILSDDNEPEKVFSLTGRFKGYQFRMSIAVWMHDSDRAN